jgi:inosose dehydratase
MIRIANAPCSWGILEFDLGAEEAPFERVLSEMLAAGYEGTELGDWGFLPTESPALKEVLESYPLAVMGAFVPIGLANPETHAPGLETALKTARLLASVESNPFIVLADDNGSVSTRAQCAGRITAAQGLSDAEWDVFARGAENIAKNVLEETGVRTVFHFHCGGYVETPQEVDALMARTDPSLLGICFDTGHYAFGGGDPLEGLRRHRDRIWHVHLKDCDPTVSQKAQREEWDYFRAVREGVFCCLGDGGVAFPEILQMLTDTDYNGWAVVEQDVFPGMGSPFQNAKNNRAYLRDHGF